MKRVILQKAFVLHRRPYRESSYLVELFTPEQGRLTVVAKGVKQLRSSLPGLLQPFIPLLVSFAGKGELLSLTQVEMNGCLPLLAGEGLFAGFYLNELLMCLLQKWDAHPMLYDKYEKTLAALQAIPLQEAVLRSFEKVLLEEIGYGFLPRTEVSLHNSFSPDLYYRFIPEQGWRVAEHGSRDGKVFSGKSLIAIAKEDWQQENCVFDAKRLIRMVLAPLLGMRTIHSRRLFLGVAEA